MGAIKRSDSFPPLKQLQDTAAKKQGRSVGQDGYRPFKPHAPVKASSNLAALAERIDNPDPAPENGQEEDSVSEASLSSDEEGGPQMRTPPLGKGPGEFPTPPDTPASQANGRFLSPALGQGRRATQTRIRTRDERAVTNDDVYKQLGMALLSTRTETSQEQQLGARPSIASSVERRPSRSMNGSVDSFHSAYAPVGRSKLSDWAPSAAPVLGRTFGIDNLPEWDAIRDDEPTAIPIQKVHRDLDWTLRRLISEQVFQQMLADPLGRHRFRQFLVAEEKAAVDKFDLYTDLQAFERLVSHVKATTEAMHNLYLSGESAVVLSLPSAQLHQLYDTLRSGFDLPVSTEDAQNHLLTSLYHNELQRFIKRQLVDQAKIRLGKIELDERDGLGDCFCLTNPRLRENPIVLVSDGFAAVTGYPRQAIIGRNCRFLQGPGTSPDSIQRVRDALNRGEGICELLLNYRRDSQPFWNLLNIVPLRDNVGRLVYFIGGQTNVTGTMVKSKGLNFLVGQGALAGSREVGRDSVHGFDVSPGMARAMGSSTASPRGLEAAPSVISTDRSTSGGGGGLFRSLRTAFRSDQPSQTIVGAESNLRKEAYPLQDQMTYFSQIYSSILVFKQRKREVIFATKQLLELFGLGTNTARDVFSSPLIHADLLDLLAGAEKAETKRIRREVKAAVKEGREFSVTAALRRGGWFKEEKGAWVTIHMTPLKDRENTPFAFVAIFS